MDDLFRLVRRFVLVRSHHGPAYTHALLKVRVEGQSAPTWFEQGTADSAADFAVQQPEAGGHDVTDVGEAEKSKGNSHNGVSNGDETPDACLRSHVTITWWEMKGKRKGINKELSEFRTGRSTCLCSRRSDCLSL